AVVFGDLKNTRMLDIDFSLEDVLHFDGETGPYLQYTYARTQSILRKSDMPYASDTQQYGHLTDDYAWQVIKTLTHYPHQLQLAAERFEPSILARYLIDLAQHFNRFYHHVKVLSGQETGQSAKLKLVQAVAHTLRKGLTLLGLQTPQEI